MSTGTTIQNFIQDRPMDSAITLLPTPTELDLQQAAALLHRFNALSLGEGNHLAGGNTLAAMAITLANIAPPGSYLIDQEIGMTISVGMNTLVSRGLSCGLIDDRVLKVLQELQGNLFAHIKQQVERQTKRNNRVSETSMFLGKNEDPMPPTVLDLLGKNDHFNEQHFEQELHALLYPPANAGVSDITDSPVIFAGIGSAEALKSITNFAHRGRIFAHLNLSVKGAAALLAEVGDELASGCPKSNQIATMVRGEVIATDPAGLLETLVRKDAGHGWVERMLWLVDHAAGPEMEITDAAKTSQQLSRPCKCFKAALDKIFAQRLNFHDPMPMRLQYPFTDRQAEWTAFLARLEPSFPGITGTLRPLVASLLFGFSQIISAATEEERPQLVPAEVEAFARLLALRMVNARAVMLNEHRRKLIETLAASIRLKLIEKPHTIREIQRRCNNIDADTIRIALERLADSGLVVYRGRNWQLSSFSPSSSLILDA
jgi:hypothetical protein